MQSQVFNPPVFRNSLHLMEYKILAEHLYRTGHCDTKVKKISLIMTVKMLRMGLIQFQNTMVSDQQKLTFVTETLVSAFYIQHLNPYTQ